MLQALATPDIVEPTLTRLPPEIEALRRDRPRVRGQPRPTPRADQRPGRTPTTSTGTSCAPGHDDRPAPAGRPEGVRRPRPRRARRGGGPRGDRRRMRRHRPDLRCGDARPGADPAVRATRSSRPGSCRCSPATSRSSPATRSPRTQTGCDLLIPESAEFATDVLTAERDGDHYVLNGTKRFITNGKVAHYATVFANIEGQPGATGLTCFVVAARQPRRGPWRRSPTRWATGPASAPSCTSPTCACRRRTSIGGEGRRLLHQHRPDEHGPGGGRGDLHRHRPRRLRDRQDSGAGSASRAARSSTSTSSPPASWPR